MMKPLTALLVLALTFPAGNVLAQYAGLSPDDVYRTAERRYGHLEYFGFYASAMESWNFTQELAPFTNLTWIHLDNPNGDEAAIDRIMVRLREAHEAGVQATLSIEPFLFLNQRGDPRPDEEIEDILVELRARIENEDLLDTVAMMYPKDEPFREFIRYRDPSFQDQYITGKVYEDIYADLTHVNELIKLVFPEKPIGVILSGYELTHRFFAIPENYDWVGFDCYSNLFSSCDDRSFVRHYSHLLDHMQPHQSLMAVPEAWVTNQDIDRADWPEVVLSRFRHHYEMALNEPRFVAFIPFIWSFDAEGEVPGLGLNRFPELFDDGVHNTGTAMVDHVKGVGLQIKQAEPVFPNMAYSETEDTRHRPPSNIRGEIMSITESGLLSAWAVNDALPHKNLHVQVLVRDGGGKVVHKSAPERTFIHDPELSRSTRIGQAIIGLHGFRYQIPREIMDLYSGLILNVELISYADGSPSQVGHIYSLAFTAGYQQVPPPSQQAEAGTRPTAKSFRVKSTLDGLRSTLEGS
jgi:hypothetical protein